MFQITFLVCLTRLKTELFLIYVRFVKLTFEPVSIGPSQCAVSAIVLGSRERFGLVCNVGKMQKINLQSCDILLARKTKEVRTGTRGKVMELESCNKFLSPLVAMLALKPKVLGSNPE